LVRSARIVQAIALVTVDRFHSISRASFTTAVDIAYARSAIYLIVVHECVVCGLIICPIAIA